MITPRRRRAFTLVELLVVVGIITVLIALLLPSLGRVRAHALEVKCAANLRTMGQALTMYVQQSGYYPGTTYKVAWTDNAMIWPTRLRQFMGGERGVFHCPIRSEEYEWPTRPAYGVPNGAMATDEYTDYGYKRGEPLLKPLFTKFSYGYNAHGTVHSWGYYGDVSRQLGLGAWIVPGEEGASNGYRELRAARVKSPSEMIAIADTGDEKLGEYQRGLGIAFRSDSFTDAPASVHRGGANVLFCDGHVRWYHQSEISWFPGKPPSLAAQANRRLWNNTNLTGLEPQ